jgi:hypothetical protein
MNGAEEFDIDVLAAEPLDADDLRALATLRAMFEASDPVPPDLAERSKIAMTVKALEAELAEIMMTTAETAGVRSAVYDRAGTITFSSDQISAMISIEVTDGSTARLSGWVTNGPASVELHERSRTQTTRTDAEGRFTFATVERGLVHLLLRRLDLPDGRPVITPAIEI